MQYYTFDIIYLSICHLGLFCVFRSTLSLRNLKRPLTALTRSAKAKASLSQSLKEVLLETQRFARLR